MTRAHPSISSASNVAQIERLRARRLTAEASVDAQSSVGRLYPPALAAFLRTQDRPVAVSGDELLS
jgi:hypothetical protein